MLIKMLVKCMLPISIVDNPAFRQYIVYLDPSFQIPSRKTIKDSSLPKMKEFLQERIKERMTKIDHPNVCTYFLTDTTTRPFSGFTFQGIDDEWNLNTICTGFDFLEG